MLTREEFKRSVEAYEDFENYLDKLAELQINIWENDSVGWFRDQYMTLLCKAMEQELDNIYLNDLEEFVYNNFSSENIDTVYDKLVGENK